MCLEVVIDTGTCEVERQVKLYFEEIKDEILSSLYIVGVKPSQVKFTLLETCDEALSDGALVQIFSFCNDQPLIEVKIRQALVKAWDRLLKDPNLKGLQKAIPEDRVSVKYY